MHFVHYNSRFGNFANAANKTFDGLAVLGIHVQVLLALPAQ